MITVQAKNLISEQVAQEIENLRKEEDAAEHAQIARTFPVHSTRLAAVGCDTAKDALPEGDPQASDSDESHKSDEVVEVEDEVEDMEGDGDSDDGSHDEPDWNFDKENVAGETKVWELCYNYAPEQCQPAQAYEATKSA